MGWYEAQATGGIADVNAYGDWLQPYSSRDDCRGDTPQALLGTAHFAHSADLTARAARRLGREADAVRMEELVAAVSAAFTRKFFDAHGKLATSPETQTGYLLALGFDLLPEALRQGAAKNLARLVDVAEGHLRTGVLGTPLLAPVLDRIGRIDLAERLTDDLFVLPHAWP